MDKVLCIADLWSVMHSMYPDVEDGREDDENYEHPMTATGMVLLSAALLRTIGLKELLLFTGYGREFISAIGLNMQNNKLWTDGRYDTSTWLSSDGTIDERKFWDHIEVACGMLWMTTRSSSFSVDSCKVYWDERGGLTWRKRNRSQ